MTDVSEPEIPIFGLILAGGRSSRMGAGTPKPLLDLAGQTMMERVANRLRPFVTELLVATDRPDLYAHIAARCIRDVAPDHRGPLAGLQTAARALASSENACFRVVTAPADTPFLPVDMLARLLEGASPDALRVASFRSRLHFACAVWPAAALRRVAEMSLDADHSLSLRSVMADYGFRTVDFPRSPDAPNEDPFFNVNTPEDLETARRFAVSGG